MAQQNDRDDLIDEIIEIELDGIELDALMEYYRDERRASLEQLDNDTIENIYGELNP